jgi:2'-5' RNA ligase
VQSLWDELEVGCGLTGIKITPIPHFSWQIAEDYNFPELQHALTELGASLPPCVVHTTGLGVFSGSRPVLYIPVVRDQMMTMMHARIWQAVKDLGTNISQYYAPDLWLPHITLGYGDMQPDELLCALHRLAHRSFDWEIRVDTLALVVQNEGDVGKLLYRLPLTGSHA